MYVCFFPQSNGTKIRVLEKDVLENRSRRGLRGSYEFLSLNLTEVPYYLGWSALLD